MDRLIILIVVILGIIGIAQLLRNYELATALRGRREEDISHKDNSMQATLMIVFMVAFYVFFAWLSYAYGGNRFGLGPAASEHGEQTDWLLDLNLWIVTAVFLLCNTLLFVFAFKYFYREDRQAYWFPHDNKLEMIWTVIPAIVLAVIIILGLKTWVSTMYPEDADASKAVKIELYSKQFAWECRYGGEANGELANNDYKLKFGNTTDVITDSTINVAIASYDEAIKKETDKMNNNAEFMADWELQETEGKIWKYKRIRSRLLAMTEGYSKEHLDSITKIANDDYYATEIHLIKGQRYDFRFRSMDVIHSAYMPHFRLQMNTVPGEPTKFSMTPTITTEEMRKIMGENFNFLLLCNKICGSGHYKMKMDIIVHESKKTAGYAEWLAANTTIAGYSPAKDIDDIDFLYWTQSAENGLSDETKAVFKAVYESNFGAEERKAFEAQQVKEGK
jgi:cytochrome c oxidase subunit 2